MPPRLRLRPIPQGTSQALLSSHTRFQSRSPACLFCSLRPTVPDQPKALQLRRASTTTTPTQPFPGRTPPPPAPAFSSQQTPPSTSTSSATDLANTLRALQQHAGILDPRFRLAVQSLQYPEGQGPVRVAVWGLGDGAGRSAKELLRLILADPLQDEQPWEQQLASHDPKTPLVVRVVDSLSGRSYRSSPAIETPQVQFSTAASAGANAKDNQDLPLIEVSSPVLKGSQLEFLVLETPAETGHENLLVAALEGESPTPVHQALVVADGIMGAATIGNVAHGDAVKGAINISLPEAPATKTGLPFFTFDPPKSREAIALFRASVANAKAYETLWLRGGVSDITHWLRDSAVQADGVKLAVRSLVKSVLEKARLEIAGQTVQTAATVTAGKAEFNTLEKGLASWSENAHEELQSELDLAFSGRRWRKLGWWKLFWRADDVSMLSASLVTQQFLPRAEQDVVYLAGRIAEAGQRTVGRSITYSAPVTADVGDDAKKAGVPEPVSVSTPVLPPTAWPTHIAFTRRYLINETVPALQALADKLVVQTVGSSGMTAAIATLTFLSGGGAGILAGEGLWVGTGVFGAGSLYEAGAVLGLGLMWSLRRLQTQWETAREFWEGGVREEGRKVVRAVEASVATALDGARTAQQELSPEEAVRRRLNEARALVDQAEEQLARLK